MKTVFKFPLTVADHITVVLPAGAKPLRFDFQNEQLCLWALVDPAEHTALPFEFRMAGTGHAIEDVPMDFVNTAFVKGCVFHFFQLLK